VVVGVASEGDKNTAWGEKNPGWRRAAMPFYRGGGGTHVEGGPRSPVTRGAERGRERGGLGRGVGQRSGATSGCGATA
jgi:hypothetical protein